MSRLDLSVVFPAKNETLRLPRTLEALRSAAWAEHLSVEVIVADDGSTDDTVAWAQSQPGVRVVSADGRGGVGAAMRAGVRAARGARVLICDADGAVPFCCLTPLWEALDMGFVVAAGSRQLGNVRLAQPWHRVAIGKIWGRLARGIVPTGVLDTQCGFKLFETQTAKILFAASRARSFALHVEVLALAQQLSMPVCEVAVDWYDIAGSKIRLGKDPWAMARELVALPRPRHSATVTRYMAYSRSQDFSNWPVTKRHAEGLS